MTSDTICSKCGVLNAPFLFNFNFHDSDNSEAINLVGNYCAMCGLSILEEYKKLIGGSINTA